MIDCWKQLTWKNRSHKTILQIIFAFKCVWHDYRILFWSQMFLLLMVAVCESLNLNDQSKTESISWRQSEMRRQM